MPRYDYKCEAGHKYEKQQPFGSPAEHPCEKCGKTARRLLVAPPLVFKASGYYKSSGRDFSSGSDSSSSSKSSSSDSKSSKDTSSAKKSDSGAAKKPAKAPSTKPKSASASAD